MSAQRDPETDQPLPTASSHPVIQQLIIQEAMEESIALGRRKYGPNGAGLRPFNGRDPLKDAEDEARDLLVYLRQVRYERDNPPVTNGLRELRDELAQFLRLEGWTDYEDKAQDMAMATELIEKQLAKAVSTIRREAFERGASPAVGVLLAEIQDHGRASQYRAGLERAVTLLTEAHAAQFHDAYQRGRRQGFKDGAVSATSVNETPAPKR